MRWTGLILTVGLLTAPLVAAANETVTYSYDHRGRLVKVTHGGTVNNGLTVTYTYDKAGNRTAVVTTGAAH